jgi:transglutaminase-like putative cysteine protease
MKRITSMSNMIVIILIAVILAAGCTSGPVTTPESKGDALLSQGEKEFTNNNLHAAQRLFVLAQENYTAAGNASAGLKARNRASIARRLTTEFPYTRSQIEETINAAFPDVPAERKAGWLPCDQSQCITSDGEVWFFSNTVGNIRYHNSDLMQKATARMNETPFYDQLKPYALATAVQGPGNYVNPVAWEGTQELSIPKGKLPKTGTLRLWVPLPIETGSQKDITILSVEPARYVRSSTGTGSEIGIVYLEVPLNEVTGDFLNFTTTFGFTSYEQRFTIDPAKVTSYNTSDPEYRKYTATGRNTAVIPEIRAKAKKIVGNETNPYLQAEKIYWHVIGHPYSSVPHERLNAAGIPESTYILTTGYGDCGTQSTYFAALCRALGIPARAVGGYQLVPGHEGQHFWSEYYLPGYGWIPNDVTVAEGAEWSHNATDADRLRYKTYYSKNLDPYRYIIQKEVDLPLIPGPGDVVMNAATLQTPKAVCDTCADDPEFGILNNWKVTIKRR